MPKPLKQITVRDVIAAMETIAPRRLAMEGDPGGLLVGDPDAPVTRVAVALDATLPIVASDAAGQGCMLVCHHPLIYHPLGSVRADDPIGAIVLHCARTQTAVAAAHTNWDIADGGVNDVLASLLGIGGTRPLRITRREPLVKIAVFVPPSSRDAVLDAMAKAGAGAIGNYDRCAYRTTGEGTFRPLPGADPHTGTVGRIEVTAEDRLEMIAQEASQSRIVEAMKAAHPYEEVAFDVFPLINGGAEFGLGRIGDMAVPAAAEAFLEAIRWALDFSEVRMAGPVDRLLRRVAVCGGAGASLMADAIAQGADALITADVRHHEFVEAEARGFVLIDAGHAATETPGARELARRLQAEIASPAIPVRFYAPDGTEEPLE